MGRYQSSQMDLTVNQVALPSGVQVPPCPLQEIAMISIARLARSSGEQG